MHSIIRKTANLFAMATIAISLAGSSAFAQGGWFGSGQRARGACDECPCGREPGRSPDGWPGGGRGAGMRRMLATLNLSADQEARIQEILRSRRQTLDPLVDQAAEARRQLVDTARASEANETAVRSAAERVGKAQAALALARAQTMAQVTQVLDPDQRAKLHATLDRVRETARERRGRMVDRRRGFADDLLDSF